MHDNGIDLDPETGGRGFAGSLAKTGYDTAYFGKAHFSTYHTDEATGSPECVKSSANYDGSWFGPYMGFQHVELMLVGHNWFLPEEPPAGLHYERWFYADGKGDEKNALYRANATDTKGAAQTWSSKLPGGLAQLDLDRRPAIDWIKGQGAARHGNDARSEGAPPFMTPGCPSPTPITRSTRQNHGRICMIRRMSTCRPTGVATSRGGPGGMKRC